MGVAGEHEVDEVAARVCDDGVGVVGLVGQKDYRCVWLGRDGEVEVRVAGAGVFEAAEPKPGAVLFYGNVLVDQNGSAAAAESVDDHGGADGHVVVAKDGVAEGSGERGDDLGAAVGGVVAGNERERAVSDKVSCEEDEVGREGIDYADDVFEEVGLGVLVKMNVAELHDAIAMEGAGQVRDGDGAMNDVGLVAGNLTRVEGHACRDGTGSDEEVASSKARRLIGLRAGHGS